MKRDEFIQYAAGLSREELKERVKKYRIGAASRVTPEAQKLFTTLDDCTTVQEHFLKTEWSEKSGVSSHIYEIRSTTAPESCPVIINIHGGGWSLDHTERDIYFCRRIAHRLNCLVIDLDYVLAPEYPYPAAIEEIEAIFNHLPELISEWGGDERRILVCGQSAGGNLSAAVMQRRKFRPLPGLLAQILCYLPADNWRNHFGDAELDGRAESTEFYGFFYNEIFEERKNSDVSLVYAKPEELRELPPTDFVIAGIDNLVEESYHYYQMVKEAGVIVSYRKFENSRHGFLVNLYDEWQEGEDYVISLMENHLAAR